jgi:hypothetical protein
MACIRMHHTRTPCRFLGAVVALADSATQASTSRGATLERLHRLAFFSNLLAAVMLSQRDEVLGLLCRLNTLIARRAHSLQAAVALSLGQQVRACLLHAPCCALLRASWRVAASLWPRS